MPGLKDLKKNYVIENIILGVGAYGKVFKAHNASFPEHKVAIKVLDRKKLKTKK